eukprot:TRINITY_DN10801_c0_g2_i2.p2 TRINITY_DN10801_c0_g2~~TRINITY_DN10801_c0_g2_i2.p2  ORF type:complete len:117 (-),score=11.91 TRINITY_DN10801_c0_g2_i2:604-933(-)
MIRRPPRSTPLYSSAASDVYKRQVHGGCIKKHISLVLIPSVPGPSKRSTPCNDTSSYTLRTNASYVPTVPKPSLSLNTLKSIFLLILKIGLTFAMLLDAIKNFDRPENF